MLKVRGLSAGYSGLSVLNNLDLELKKGEVLLLLGPNGAGKTTLLRTIVGLHSASAGTVYLKDREISSVPLSKRKLMGITYISEESYFPSLTVRENLQMAALGTDRATAKERMQRVFSIFPVLREKATEKVSSLSGGQRKFMILATVFMSEPEVMLVDEPSAGLSPVYVDRIIDVIRMLKDGSHSILLAEQNVEFTQLADRLCILENGRISYNGSPEEAMRNDAIRKSYFSVA